MWEALFLAGIGTLIGVGGAKFFGRRKRAPQSELPESPARLERLENAVDAMAIELERIGEGQRFVTKLLAERDKK